MVPSPLMQAKPCGGFGQRDHGERVAFGVGVVAEYVDHGEVAGQDRGRVGVRDRRGVAGNDVGLRGHPGTLVVCSGCGRGAGGDREPRQEKRKDRDGEGSGSGCHGGGSFQGGWICEMAGSRASHVFICGCSQSGRDVRPVRGCDGEDLGELGQETDGARRGSTERGARQARAPTRSRGKRAPARGLLVRRVWCARRPVRRRSVSAWQSASICIPVTPFPRLVPWRISCRLSGGGWAVSAHGPWIPHLTRPRVEAPRVNARYWWSRVLAARERVIG